MSAGGVICGRALDGPEPEAGCIAWSDRAAASVTFFPMIPDLSRPDLSEDGLYRQAAEANARPRLIRRAHFQAVEDGPELAGPGEAP